MAIEKARWNTDLRDDILAAFARHGNFRYTSPVWQNVALAFEWDCVWPVIDDDGYLTGDVGIAGEDGMLVTDDWEAIISREDAELGGWEIDEDGCIATPPACITEGGE